MGKIVHTATHGGFTVKRQDGTTVGTFRTLEAAKSHADDVANKFMSTYYVEEN